MRHQFGLRMLNVHDGRPMQKLWLYETNNQQFTLDDFIAVNSQHSWCQLVFPFYIGFMSRDDVFKQYSEDIFDIHRSFSSPNL